MKRNGHETGEVRRLTLVLEYDGTEYRGFQRQANEPTVQGELEKAIGKLTGERTAVRGSSRTDSGAHAKGQVVDFLTHAPYLEETFIKALNWHLPASIKIRAASQVPLSFDARRDASTRVYRYTLYNSRWPSPLLMRYSQWIPKHLDVALMRQAAGYLVGTHDFSAFTVSLPPTRSPVRRVSRWDVWREDELVLIEAEANGFLPHQIRRTNGVLVEIGLGKLADKATKEIMNGKSSDLKGTPCLQAKGLCLMHINLRNSSIGTRNGHETQ